MTNIEIINDDLIVRIESWDRIWAFKSQMTIPLAHVRGAEPYSKAAAGKPFLRVMGTSLPGVITAGTFRQEKDWVFWDVREQENAIVVHLADEHYAKLVIEVADPAAAVEAINRAIGGSAG